MHGRVMNKMVRGAPIAAAPAERVNDIVIAKPCAAHSGVRRGGSLTKPICIACLRTNTTRVGSRKVSVRYWRGNDYYIQAAFDENDSAIAWSLHEAQEWSVIERIRGFSWRR